MSATKLYMYSQVQSACQIILHHLDWATNCNHEILISSKVVNWYYFIIADSH